MNSPETIKRLLETTKTIALVGASIKPHRDSYRIFDFLQQQGFRVIPVNPRVAGQQLLGETIVADLGDITESIDWVDIFQNPEAAGVTVDRAIELGMPAVWMQLGVINPEAADRAEQAGMDVVMDRCPWIEFQTHSISR